MTAIHRPPSFDPATLNLPGQSRFVERPGGLRLHYLDEGAGPTVLMVHGNPTWCFFWRHLIKELTPGFRSLAPDHLGMGLSSRPEVAQYSFRLADRVADLKALVDEAVPDGPIHLVVHDWGGPIGLGWAVENQERVASVTIMNTGLRVPPGYRLPWRLAIFKRLAPLGAFLAGRLNLFAGGTAVFGTAGQLSAEARRGFLAPYRTPRERLAIAKFVEDIPLAPAHPSYDFLAAIDRQADFLAHKPLLLVWGLGDFVFNRAVYLDWRQRFPQAESLALPEAGHYLMEDEPRRAGGKVRDFISRWSRP